MDEIEFDPQQIDGVKAYRHERAAYYNTGSRSPVDGLTDRERALLAAVRAAGCEISQGWLSNRQGGCRAHSRVVTR